MIQGYTIPGMPPPARVTVVIRDRALREDLAVRHLLPLLFVTMLRPIHTLISESPTLVQSIPKHSCSTPLYKQIYHTDQNFDSHQLHRRHKFQSQFQILLHQQRFARVPKTMSAPKDGNLGIRYGFCYTMTDTNDLPLNRDVGGTYQSGGDIGNLIFRVNITLFKSLGGMH